MQNEGRFGAATDEQIALARKIAADFYAADMDPEFNLFAPSVRAGKHDEDEAVQCALRAIQMTTELAAKMAEWAHMVPPDGGSPTAEESDLAASIASALRSGDHLRGHP